MTFAKDGLNLFLNNKPNYEKCINDSLDGGHLLSS